MNETRTSPNRTNGAPPPPPEANPANGETPSALRQWHAEHGKKKYTPAFDASLWSIVRNPTKREDRLWALVVIRSWGHPAGPRHFAVDPGSGQHLTLTELAVTIDVPKQTASRWLETLLAENRLYLEDGCVYPVDDPEDPSKANRPTPVGLHEEKAKVFREFRAQWSQENPDAVRQREEARAIVEQINKAELVAYRRWRESRRSGTNGTKPSQTPPESVPDSAPNGPTPLGPPNKEEDKIRGEQSSSSSSSSSPEQARPESGTTTTIHPKLSSEEGRKLIGAALASYGRPDTPFIEALWADVRARDPQAHPADVAQVIHDKAPLRRSGGLQFFRTAVPPCFPLVMPVGAGAGAGASAGHRTASSFRNAAEQAGAWGTELTREELERDLASETNPLWIEHLQKRLRELDEKEGKV